MVVRFPGLVTVSAPWMIQVNEIDEGTAPADGVTVTVYWWPMSPAAGVPVIWPAESASGPAAGRSPSR